MFFNTRTGERRDFPPFTPGRRSEWLFTQKAAALERYTRRLGLDVTLLTLTQGEELSGASADVSRVMNAMGQKFKRAGEQMKYVGVLEIQPKRFEETGDLVRHWHIGVGCKLR